MSAPDTDLSVADVLRLAMASAYQRLVDNEPGLREMSDDEAVHQARVATRRLRSDLGTFARWLDRHIAAELRAELRWLGAELGAVRDLDVMRARLRGHASALPTAEADAAERVIRRLDADREAARVEMLATIGNRRYMNLRDMMAAAAIHVPCTPPARATPAAVLAAEVRDGWTKLRKSARKLGDRPADEALHRVRVRAKRTRYAAEACEPAFGKRARALAGAMARVQDVLGEHHDAVVAGAWIAKTAHECTPGEAYALGMLAEIERASASTARAAFPAVWQAASRKRLRAWL